MTRLPDQRDRATSVTHFGGQLQLFPVHRPLGGVFDPFLTAGAGAFRVNTSSGNTTFSAGTTTRLALVPGAGVRIPIPNRFQLRFDARDALVSRNDFLGATESRWTNNWEFGASLGLTF